jgi:trimeric autotransporter adhesin
MRSTLSVLVVTSLSLLAACGGGGAGTGTASPPVLSGIQVSAASLNLIVGTTAQLTATGGYSNGTTQDLTSKVSWSSSDSSIATVDATGMVTPKTHGSVTISASSSGVNGSATLTISATLVSIAVTSTALSIAPSTKEQFIATGTYNDGSTQNLTGNVSWASSNTSVATVSSSAPTQGMVKALSAGTTSISATSGSVTGSATLTVTSATVVSIAVAPTNASISIGIAQQFTATGTFSDSSTQDITGSVVWNSSATGVASITVSGLASAFNIGTTTISASFGGVSGSAPLTVNAANISSLAITPSSPSIAQGTTIQFTATGTFNNGSTRNLTRQVTWTSSDTTVASIGPSNGIAIGQPRTVTGTTNITATLGSASATVTLTVTTATLSSITVAPATQTVPIGGQAGYTATGLFSDSSSQDITSICKWASGNTSVATVGSGGGSLLTATGVAPGTTSINATLGTTTGSATLTVSSATLLSIALTPANAILAPASTLGYNAIGTYSDGGQHSVNGTATWSSSDPSIAIISGSGTATGESAGAVTITVQSGSISATASLIVEGSTLTSIQVTPNSTKLPQTIQGSFIAKGTFSDGNVLDITSVVTWTSSAGSVATISTATGSHGVATAIAPGQTTISATFGGQVGSAILTVTNATLVSISVTPANATLSQGSGQQYIATGTFSDQSTVKITGQANWSSSDVSVAVINSQGQLTTANPGTSTISASLNGVTGSTAVTVQ